MLPMPRPYQDDRDLARMLALLQAGRAARSVSYYPHVGDLQWWLYYPPLGGSWWEHIYLWYDPAGERLLGWALIEPSGETFDVYCQPELSGTPAAAAMYAWAEGVAMERARRAGTEEVGVFWIVPGDAFRVGWLEGRGYHVSSRDAALGRSLEGTIAEPALPESFTIRPCRGLAEVESRARAQYGAFKSSAPFAAYVERFASFMQSAAYPSAADWVVAAPDGQVAAFAVTWRDEANRVGLFEPVGTHPDFTRRGLGKALLLAALRGLQEQGMREAIVCTLQSNTPAIGLYQSVGFTQYSEFRWYSKKVTE